MKKFLKKTSVYVMTMILSTAFSLSALTAKAEPSEVITEGASYTGKNYLLYGFNALEGSYVNTTNTGSKPILSNAKVQQQTADPTSYGSTNYIYDSSIHSFYEKFSASVNVNYKGVAFSGKAKTEFNTTQNSTENRLYIRYTAYFYTKDYSNEDSLINMKKSLADDFVNDVKALYNTQPQLIFQNYGTHLITQYYTGGRLDLNYTYRNKVYKSEYEIISSLNASYGRISGGAAADSKNESELIETSATLRSFSTGGTTNAQISGTSIAGVANEFKNWKDSIDQKPDICGVKEGSLYPIWDLFSDQPEIYQALKNAYDVEQERKAMNLKNMDRGPITDIIALYGDSYDEVERKLPEGYYIVQAENPTNIERPNLDANHYGRGYFIFLAYTYKPVVNKQRKQLNPIVDFKVVKGKSTTLTNYQKVNLDLNKGQGGPYLYLWFRRATDTEYNNKDTLYISSIKGYYGESYNTPANWFVNEDSLELNKGIKNRDGKDNYTNLMYQNDYRLILDHENLKDYYEEEPIVAISDFMELEDTFDPSKPLVESDDEVLEYEEGAEDIPDDENPDSEEEGEGQSGEDESGEKNPDDESIVPDDGDKGQPDQDESGEKNPDDENPVPDESGEGQADQDGSGEKDSDGENPVPDESGEGQPDQDGSGEKNADDKSVIPDESGEGQPTDDDSGAKNPDDNHPVADESDEGLLEQGIIHKTSEAESFADDNTAADVSKEKSEDMIGSEDEFLESGLLEGSFLGSDVSSETELPNEELLESGLISELPATGDKSNWVVIIYPMISMLVVALLLIDQKKRRIS